MLLSEIWAVMLNNRAKKDSQKVLDLLDIHAGDTIADIGSGGGYFTFELAKRTGQNGKVYAADTNKRFLTRIESVARKNSLHNIETVVCTEDGCPLQRESCDLVFMRNVFHHIKEPVPYFRKLSEGLKPGGRIAVLDWKNTKGGFVGLSGHFTPEAEIHRALKAAGLLIEKSIDILDDQSFNIYRK